MRYFGEYQNEIYFGGLSGGVPKLPVNFNLLEQKAVEALPLSVVSYVMGGCGDEFTQLQNVEAFNHWGLVPRMMVDCSTRELSIHLFVAVDGYPTTADLRRAGVTRVQP